MVFFFNCILCILGLIFLLRDPFFDLLAFLGLEGKGLGFYFEKEISTNFLNKEKSLIDKNITNTSPTVSEDKKKIKEDHSQSFFERYKKEILIGLVVLGFISFFSLRYIINYSEDNSLVLQEMMQQIKKNLAESKDAETVQQALLISVNNNNNSVGESKTVDLNVDNNNNSIGESKTVDRSKGVAPIVALTPNVVNIQQSQQALYDELSDILVLAESFYAEAQAIFIKLIEKLRSVGFNTAKLKTTEIQMIVELLEKVEDLLKRAEELLKKIRPRLTSKEFQEIVGQMNLLRIQHTNLLACMDIIMNPAIPRNRVEVYLQEIYSLFDLVIEPTFLYRVVDISDILYAFVSRFYGEMTLSEKLRAKRFTYIKDILSLIQLVEKDIDGDVVLLVQIVDKGNKKKVFFPEEFEQWLRNLFKRAEARS